MFTNQELKDLEVLLKRVSLQGNEAIPVAQLQLKVKKLIEETPAETMSETTGTENSPN